MLNWITPESLSQKEMQVQEEECVYSRPTQRLETHPSVPLARRLLHDRATEKLHL